MDPVLIEPLVFGLVLAGVAVVLLVVAVRRRSTPQSPFREMRPTAAWEAAQSSLVTLGMRRQDAETFVMPSERVTQSLYLKLEPRDGTIWGWLDRAYPGGAIEQFIGGGIELRPGSKAGSGLEGFVASHAGELLLGLGRNARLKVTAPEIPGDTAKLSIRCPLSAAEHPSLAVRVLMAVDAAARTQSASGPRAPLPPAAQAWEAAGPLLQAQGLGKQSAECYVRSFGRATWSLYVTVNIRDATVDGWVERPCPGGAIEQFFGAIAELEHDRNGRTPLEQFASGAVREVMALLPRGARLKVKAPEMPGDSYELRVSSPLRAPEHAATVARVLLLLDEAAQGKPAAGAHSTLPPVVQAWMAAGPSLEALGLHRQDAECYVRSHGMASQSLYVTIQVAESTVRGWVERPAPGGALEAYLGGVVELGPGDLGSSDLAGFIAGEAREVLGRLPRGARLKVEAPEIRGDTYKLDVSTPFSSPVQAATVARLLLLLDAAAQRPGG